ncbi:pirin family protein, partial [Nocardioides antri]
MPAITVDDLTVLDRLKEPGEVYPPRPVWQVVTAPLGYEGEGFPVRRAFAGLDLRQLGPF